MRRSFLLIVCMPILLSGLHSCIENQGFDTMITPESEEFVLIYAYISPEQDSLKVSVSKTLPFSEVNPSEEPELNDFVIKDASVHLRNEANEEVQLFYNPVTLNYESSAAAFTIAPGAKYFLEVEVGDQLFTSSCTVPLKGVDELNYSLEATGTIRDFLRVTFQDIENIDNYYLMSISSNEMQDLSFFGSSLVSILNDMDREGGLIENQFEISETAKGTTATIVLSTVDKTIYESVRIARENGSFLPVFSGDDLTVSPNTIVGEGGLGVFAGYRLITKEIQL